ncbi:MAG: ribosome assembly factor SBDS [Candidatus Aenigmatarchaeota archaeon]
MVTVDEAIIAKFDRDGKHFEVLVDPDLAYDLKEGKIISLSRMLAANIIFTDAKKGTKSSEADLQKGFDSYDIEKIAETIVKKGEIQLTTEFRRKKVEEKKKQIATFISRNAINPQTRLPHPPDRILSALENAKVSIDPFKPAEQQVENVVKALKEIMPISFDELTFNVEIPAAYSSRCYGVMKEFNAKSQYLSDGSLSASVRIPAGMKENLFRKLNAICEGNARIEEVK